MCTETRRIRRRKWQEYDTAKPWSFGCWLDRLGGMLLDDLDGARLPPECQLLAEAAAANGLQKVFISDDSAKYKFENSSDAETLYWEGVTNH